jgi:hypothetical protein
MANDSNDSAGWNPVPFPLETNDMVIDRFLLDPDGHDFIRIVQIIGGTGSPSYAKLCSLYALMTHRKHNKMTLAQAKIALAKIQEEEMADDFSRLDTMVPR